MNQLNPDVQLPEVLEYHAAMNVFIVTFRKSINGFGTSQRYNMLVKDRMSKIQMIFTNITLFVTDNG